MKAVAASFGWPFRGAWQSRFVIGALMVILLPIAFIPLLGYAIAAVRAAEEDPDRPPPAWRPSTRLLVDGLWTTVVLLLLSAPFVLALNPLAAAIPFPPVYAHVVAAFLLALPWGFLLLLVMPHATSRFAATGHPRDLFDFPSAFRGVKRDFQTWNVVAAAMVTAWGLGVASVGLLCAGIVPGIFYAILVSAHASAALYSPEAAGADLSSR